MKKYSLVDISVTEEGKITSDMNLQLLNSITVSKEGIAKISNMLNDIVIVIAEDLGSSVESVEEEYR